MEVTQPKPPHPSPWPGTYSFGGFVLTPASGALRRPGGVEVPLRPKSAEVLRQLAKNAGRVVTREELLRAV